MTRLTSDIIEIRRFFMSIRNYESSQTNHRKNVSSPFARKSNLKIINILDREILNSGIGRKTLSKRHRPKTGRAARWELIYYTFESKIPWPVLWKLGEKRSKLDLVVICWYRNWQRNGSKMTFIRAYFVSVNFGLQSFVISN